MRQTLRGCWASALIVIAGSELRPRANASQLPSQSLQLLPGSDPNGLPFVFRFSQPVAIERCSIRIFQAGAFGVLGGPGRPADRSSGVGTEYVFRTGTIDNPVRTLKASVWCPGFAFALVDVAALGPETASASIVLKPLKDVPIAGRVLPADDGVDLTGAEVIARYSANGSAQFFNLMDCGVPFWEIARSRIARDASVQFSVPDFINDPVVARFNSKGSFRLDAQWSTPPHNYSLTLESEPFGDIPVASTYSRLVLKPRKH